MSFFKWFSSESNNSSTKNNGRCCANCIYIKRDGRLITGEPSYVCSYYNDLRLTYNIYDQDCQNFWQKK